MTLEEKLRFLADRVEDGKAFLLGDVEHVFDNNMLKIGGFISKTRISDLKFSDLKLKPRWEFTEDEKLILKNLDDKWRWVSRNANGALVLHDEKPCKKIGIWVTSLCYHTPFSFNHLFQSVQWEDDEPCEFRKFI